MSDRSQGSAADGSYGKLLPPHPDAEAKHRALREVLIPFSAWSMYEVFTELEARLKAIPPTPDRPIVAEASGDTLVFRLATFLFQPLLAAEKAGEADVVPLPTNGTELDIERQERWKLKLRALGDFWRTALPCAIAGEIRSSRRKRE